MKRQREERAANLWGLIEVASIDLKSQIDVALPKSVTN
jgi:hypothetical protein